MKRFFIGLLLISFMVSAEPEKEVCRYQLETIVYESKKGKYTLLKLYLIQNW